MAVGSEVEAEKVLALSLGRRLHSTRRRRRISMDRAASDTRIRRDYLEALEGDDFTFQAPVYVKGFLVNYARYLRLDPNPLVVEFEAHTGAERNEALVLAEQNAAWTKNLRVPSNWWPLLVTAIALLVLTTAAAWSR